MLTANEITFFAPPIQVDSPPPEDFDREFGELEFDRPLVPFEFTLRNTYPGVTTPSSFKFTDSGHMSDYSDVAPSGRAVHGTPRSSNSSNTLSDSPQSFGSLPSSPVPSNHGISNHVKSFSVSPDDRSRTQRQSASPDVPAPKKKLNKLFMCNICKHRFSRKHDVCRHIEIFHEDNKSALSTHPNSLITTVPITGAAGT